MILIKNKDCEILEKGINEFDSFDNFPNFIETLGIFLKNVNELPESAGFIAELAKPVNPKILEKYKIMQAENHFPELKGKILIGYSNAFRAIEKKKV